MKINNTKNISQRLYYFLFILFLNIVFLFFSKLIFTKSDTFLYTIFFLIMGIIIWQITLLKIIWLEISEHIISVKSRHLIMYYKKAFPVLEIPLEQLEFCQIEKGLIDYFLVIRINSKRGKRDFYYRLGLLSKKQIKNYKERFINIKNEEQLSIQ